jgi:hypothetical protein
MSSNIGINGAFLFAEDSMGNREIRFLHDPILELLCQVKEGLVVLSYHHDPGSPFIQTMDNARSQHAIDSSKIFAMMDQGIHQCPCRIPCARVNDHPRRFVNHDDG